MRALRRKRKRRQTQNLRRGHTLRCLTTRMPNRPRLTSSWTNRVVRRRVRLVVVCLETTGRPAGVFDGRGQAILSKAGEGTYTFELTVTDNYGAATSGQTRLRSHAGTQPCPRRDMAVYARTDKTETSQELVEQVLQLEEARQSGRVFSWPSLHHANSESTSCPRQGPGPDACRERDARRAEPWRI